jgi:hypothetical protein
MANENNTLKKWLDKLQEESWNLELLISGFSIFGLFKAKEFLETFGTVFEANDFVPDTLMAWFFVFFLMVHASVLISIVFLLLHVFLRALWIGAIGIRSVSGEIDYSKLNYNTKITNYLKKKLGSFDDYILKLEKASSLIFGYTFLLFLILCSVFFYFFLIWAVTNGTGGLVGGTSFWWISVWVVPLFFILLALFITIDFFTGGALKKIKNKRFASIYIFFHKGVTWLTLSFLWKPLYFNLIDHKKTKWLIFFIIPIFVILYALDTVSYNSYSIFPETLNSDSYKVFKTIGFKEKARTSFQAQFYDNLRKQNEVIQVMSLPNHKMETKSIELFVKLSNTDENSILKKDSTIKQIAIKGFNLPLVSESEYEKELLSREKSVPGKNNDYYKTEQQRYRENLQKILHAAKKIYSVSINGEYIDNDSIDILFHQHANQAEEGFLLFFYAENLEKGMNHLTLEKLDYNYNEKRYDTLGFTIPFIYNGD